MTDPTPAPAAAAPFTDAEDKQYTTLATFLNIILIIPALVFYFAFANRGPKIKVQSKENLNWSINVTAIYIILLILSAATVFLFGIGLIFTVLAWLVAIVNLIFSILGGVKTQTGELYKYPVNIRWIK